MPECECMHVVIQDPSLVVCARHECLGLFVRGKIEFLVVDAFEAAFNYCILMTFCLKDKLVQIDIIHTHFLTIDYYIARNSFRRLMYDILFINQTVYLWSQTNELHNAMSFVIVFVNGSRWFFVNVEER